MLLQQKLFELETKNSIWLRSLNRNEPLHDMNWKTYTFIFEECFQSIIKIFIN